MWKRITKLESTAYENYEYGYLGSCYIKSAIYKRLFFRLKSKNRVVSV